MNLKLKPLRILMTASLTQTVLIRKTWTVRETFTPKHSQDPMTRAQTPSKVTEAKSKKTERSKFVFWPSKTKSFCQINLNEKWVRFVVY